MPRPKKADRSTVASAVVNLRLTPAEAAGVRRLVAEQAKQLAPMGIDPTTASVVRGLIRKAIAELGEDVAPVEPQAPAKPTKPTKPRGR